MSYPKPNPENESAGGSGSFVDSVKKSVASISVFTWLAIAAAAFTIVVLALT